MGGGGGGGRSNASRRKVNFVHRMEFCIVRFIVTKRITFTYAFILSYLYNFRVVIVNFHCK
jgi:hypothetical protein